MMDATMSDLIWWALVKAPLVLAGAALTAVVLRGASAATRHRVWATAVIATLALPLLSLLVPSIDVALPGPVTERAVTAASVRADEAVAVAPRVAAGATRTAEMPRAAATAATAPVAPVVASSEGPASAVAPAAATPRVGLSELPIRAGMLASMIWAMVATGLLLRLLFDRVRTRRMERMHVDVTSDGLGRDVRGIAAERGVRDLRVLLGAPDAMPVTWGTRRPVLLLPLGAERWSAARLEAVVRHELAHVGRGDVRLQFLADLLCALHWFDPLAWYAAHRMRVEREHACDDEVLAAGARPSDYATELLVLARRFREERLAGVAMARRGGLRDRLESVLDERRRRGESRGARRGIHAAALLFALPLAAFTPRQDARPATASSTAIIVHAPPSRAPVALLAESRPSPAVQEALLCWGDMRDGSTSVRRNDERFELEWDLRDCSVDIEVTGGLRFNDDFTRITGITGGMARFQERDGGRERRVEVRPGSGGMELRWWVDGDERPFDAEGQRWLDAMLLNTLRRGGLAVDERALGILRNRGLDGLLDEMQYLRGDWVRGQYFMVALGSSELDDGRAVRLVEEAAATIGSDHTLSEILQTVAQRRSLANDALRAAFIEAAGTIGSDHARGQVLESAIHGPALPERDLAAILDAVAGIGSDHTKSELLVSVAQRHELSPELRAAYLRVNASIGSDHSVGRAAHALLDRGEPSASELRLVLDVAAEIDSDHELGELLRRLSRLDLRDADVRDTFESVLADIDSDHTLGQVLTEMMDTREMDRLTADVVLRASRSIDSDHTLGEVLTRLVRRGGVTADTRAAFDDALASIGSDHTRDQVERALRTR